MHVDVHVGDQVRCQVFNLLQKKAKLQKHSSRLRLYDVIDVREGDDTRDTAREGRQTSDLRAQIREAISPSDKKSFMTKQRNIGWRSFTTKKGKPTSPEKRDSSGTSPKSRK